VSGPGTQDVTGLLHAWRSGDGAALDRLMPVVYTELHRIAHFHMRGERQGHSLQTTALVNEAYLRLVDSDRVRWRDRVHFFAMSAQLMRRVLVDAARSRDSLKRGGDIVHVDVDRTPIAAATPDVDVIALDELLTKLEALDGRKSRVVELRYFGGLSVEETAEALDVSPQTVMRDWSTAKLWLLRELTRGAGTAAANES
jgi:RNA polymerase sigma factor (TIGR02999 family)